MISAKLQHIIESDKSGAEQFALIVNLINDAINYPLQYEYTVDQYAGQYAFICADGENNYSDKILNDHLNVLGEEVAFNHQNAFQEAKAIVNSALGSCALYTCYDDAWNALTNSGVVEWFAYERLEEVAQWMYDNNKTPEQAASVYFKVA